MFFRLEIEVTSDTIGSLGARAGGGGFAHTKKPVQSLVPKLVKWHCFIFVCFFLNFKMGNRFFLFFVID